MATASGTTLTDQKNLERQMGCMAGFFQLFDRHHLLTGKRIYSAKRLPPLSIADSESESVKSTKSPPEDEPQTTTSPGSDWSKPPPEGSLVKTPNPMSVFEIKEGSTNRTSWKFREAPRLSLDSRATTDANGTLHRKHIRIINQPQSLGPSSGDDTEKQLKSTSVIARLMGLEPLAPSSESSINTHSPQLQRSASESRVARYELTHTFTLNFPQKLIPTCYSPARVSTVENVESSLKEQSVKPAKCEVLRTNYRRNQQQRNYYDSGDFFPEPKQTAVVSVYGEIEKRLKMSGIDGSSKDLDTLKHILEALQLKGLLHSNKSSVDQNFVYETTNEPPIVVMRPSRSPFNGNESPPSSYRSRQVQIPCRSRNSVCETLPSVSPCRRVRNSVSPTRSESSVKSTSSSAPGRKQYNADAQRSRNASPEHRRVLSPVSSPKPSFRRSFDTQTASSPRNRRSDELVPISKSYISHSPRSDHEANHLAEYKEGKSLLSRCDMLLQSIADMNSSNPSEQPSPISVLDSSFYKEDESSSSSPSPIPKRSIDFKDLQVDFDEDSSWTSSAISTINVSPSDDSDFNYIADVLRTLTCLPNDFNVFPLLEKQQCKRGKDGSNTSKMKRKLIFDNVLEILNKCKQLPTWTANSFTDYTSLPYVWSEFKKIRERDESDQELFQVICSILKKDMAIDTFKTQNEVVDAVIDIERLVFKDLIGEAISDLASATLLCYPSRKLAF